jgi:hypothetical protein
MENNSEDEKQKKPETPKFPKWAAACGWIVLTIYPLGKQLLDLEPLSILVFTLPLAVLWITGFIIHYRAQKRHEILDLSWRISNLKGWIEYRKEILEEGQPWFDEEDPSEWKFEHKYAARQAKEKLEELEEQLEQKLRAI